MLAAVTVKEQPSVAGAASHKKPVTEEKRHHPEAEGAGWGDVAKRSASEPRPAPSTSEPVILFSALQLTALNPLETLSGIEPTQFTRLQNA